MDCTSFQEWLDGGRPENRRVEAREHSRRCARCAEELEAARAIESALGQRFATAPASFTEKVIERLPARPGAAPIPVQADDGTDFPWWLRIFAEPSVVLSSALAVALIIGWPSLGQQVSRLLRAASGSLESFSVSGSIPAGIVTFPALPAHLLIALLPVVAVFAWFCYRAGMVRS